MVSGAFIVAVHSTGVREETTVSCAPGAHVIFLREVPPSGYFVRTGGLEVGTISQKNCRAIISPVPTLVVCINKVTSNFFRVKKALGEKLMTEVDSFLEEVQIHVVRLLDTGGVPEDSVILHHFVLRLDGVYNVLEKYRTRAVFKPSKEMKTSLAAVKSAYMEFLKSYPMPPTAMTSQTRRPHHSDATCQTKRDEVEATEAISEEETRFVYSTLLSAEMHYYGTDPSFPRDLTRAVQEYSLIATMCSRAAFQLGVCLQYGFGTKVNVAEAKNVFRSGANNGCHVCALHCALLLTDGHEAAEAVTLLERVCGDARTVQCHPEALVALGGLHESGAPESNLPSDVRTALDMYQTAARRGHPSGGYHYARLQMALGHPLATKMMAKVANAGHPDANNALGECYEKFDLRAAEQCYRRAAQCGHTRAKANLGYVMLLGRRFSDAMQLLYEAAELDDATALLHLGAMYHMGVGVPQDAIRAVQFFKVASEKGNAEAMVMLGHAYYEGLGGLSQDMERAKEWYRAANIPEAGAHLMALEGTTVVATTQKPQMGRWDQSAIEVMMQR